MSNLFEHCRTGVSKTKSKVTKVRKFPTYPPFSASHGSCTTARSRRRRTSEPAPCRRNGRGESTSDAPRAADATGCSFFRAATRSGAGFGAARKPDAGRHAEDVGIDGHHLLAPQMTAPTTLAVLRPTPGNRCKASRSDGTTPPNSVQSIPPWRPGSWPCCWDRRCF